MLGTCCLDFPSVCPAEHAKGKELRAHYRLTDGTFYRKSCTHEVAMVASCPHSEDVCRTGVTRFDDIPVYDSYSGKRLNYDIIKRHKYILHQDKMPLSS